MVVGDNAEARDRWANVNWRGGGPSISTSSRERSSFATTCWTRAWVLGCGGKDPRRTCRCSPFSRNAACARSRIAAMSPPDWVAASTFHQDPKLSGERRTQKLQQPSTQLTKGTRTAATCGRLGATNLSCDFGYRPNPIAGFTNFFSNNL